MEAAVGNAIGGLIVAAILSRLSKRSKEAQTIQVTINVDNRRYVTVVDGNRVVKSELDGDGEIPESAGNAEEGAEGDPPQQS